LGTPGKQRLRERLRAAVSGDGTLVALFHLLRTAGLQRSRGFEVEFAGKDGRAYALLPVHAGKLMVLRDTPEHATT
jgi:acetylornithine deacetylase/succinyl-diaminopimelate desuccinylase-like protein